ncbi:hypothetical protein PG993_012462 [Apiospora rasikravindrae]|uniref:Actin-like ATPase domain-containing protein n=1 Tax=Apiospora rasikravindrae TaxID=990691 RepID=A0ABR1S4A4_9PEZI
MSLVNSPPESPKALADATPSASEQKVVILTIDFGTSNTAIQFVILEPNEIDNRAKVSPNRILPITHYPEDVYNSIGDQMKNQVPTAFLYPPDPEFRESDPRFGPVKNEGEVDHRNIALFGYEVVDGVHEAADAKLRRGTKLPVTEERIECFKLLFQDDPQTREIREELQPIVERLQDTRRIPRGAPHVAITADYFTRLLSHAKYQLKVLHHLDKDYKVEVVLCVPVVFRLNACMDLQKALAKALCRVRLGGAAFSDKWIPRFSMITEPEAGAEWALKEYPIIEKSSRMLILDSGGGTCDTSLYQTSASLPLRLAREDAPPTGDLCGSNILNGMFYKHILRRLRAGATYLEEIRGKTLPEIAQEITWEQFEQRKRGFNAFEEFPRPQLFKCEGLVPDTEHKFGKNVIRVDHGDISMMFASLLEKVWALTQTQLTMARERGRPIKYIIMLGGFSRSESYQIRVQKGVADYNAMHKPKIELLGQGKPIESSPTAIAQGAALRALDKSSAPTRTLPSSYGILRHIEDHEDSPDYKYLPPKTNRGRSRFTYLDGKWWFFDRIIWFAQKQYKGEEIGKDWTYTITSDHVFANNESEFLCEELIFISDSAMESGYLREGKRNRGCRCIGKIVANMTSLRDERLILPEQNGRKQCWRVSIELVIRIKGLNLEAEARYRGEKKGECVVNMAPAFVAFNG